MSAGEKAVSTSAMPQGTSTLTRWSHHEEDGVDKRPLDVRLIARLFRYTRPHAQRRNILLAMVLLRAIQLPCLMWIVAAIIKGPVAARDTAGVLWGALWFLLLALSTQVVLHFRQRYALELGESVVHDLRNDLFAKLQQMPLGYFQRTKVGRIISRLFSDVEDVRVGVQEVLFVSLVQLGQMLVAAAFMLWYDALLFLLVLGLAPVLALINRHFRRRISAALRAMRDSFSRVTATLAESVNGIRVTQGFVRQRVNARMFHELVDDHSTYNFASMRLQGLFLPLLELNNQLFVAVLMVVGGYQALAPDARVDVGDLVGFFFMAAMFFSPISVLGQQYNQALIAMAGAERLFRILDMPPEWTDPPDAAPAPQLQGGVRLEHVSFGYLPGVRVLHDVDFSVEPGQTVALVGHTGGGKSTIVNLVAKFYLPDEGRVLVDGRDTRVLESRSLRRQIGIVPQQNFLFTGTVAENIRWAHPQATDDDIRDVLARLDCLDLVEALPLGIDTQVGERGHSLSLGQRQLVCFARALVADPCILILDEATSSVDALTERRIQRALSRLVAGRTSFIVAHRLSTIRHADLVLVLDHGRIIERGTHDSLLAAGGSYARLYQRFASPGAA